VDTIWQGCLLSPVFGSSPVAKSWITGDVLDIAPKFYLDKYLDLQLFEEYEHCETAMYS